MAASVTWTSTASPRRSAGTSTLKDMDLGGGGGGDASRFVKAIAVGGGAHKKSQQGCSRASSLAPWPVGPRPRGALLSTLYAPSLAVSARRDLGGGGGGDASRFVKAIAVGAIALVSILDEEILDG